MNILDAFKQLRDDLKTWVTNNLNALNAKIDEKTIPIDDKLDSNSTNPVQNKAVTKAINNIPRFSGDYNDLTNAPNITEDESGNMVIADESGNIIFKADADGMHTTAITLNGETVATESYVDEAVKVPILNIDFELSAHNISKTAHQDIRELLGTEPVDKQIENAIAKIPTPDVSGQIAEHNTSEIAHSDIRIAIENTKNTISTQDAIVLLESQKYTDFLVGNTYTKAETDAVIEATKEELSESIVTESDEWKVIDEAGNIIFSVDATGAHTTELTLNGESAATESYVDDAIANIEFPTTDLTGYATEVFVTTKIAEAKLEGEDIDLSGYATKDDIKDFATESYVSKAIADFVEADPVALKTLEELSKALDEHEDAYDALLETVGSKTTQEDLENLKEEITEEVVSEQQEFHVVDNSGNIVTSIDANGVTTTTVAAQNLVLDGNDIIDIIRAESQSGASIIDVVALPTSDIDTNATYRLLNGTFLLSNVALYDSICIIKENTNFLNESGLPLVEKHDDAFAYTGYYCVSNSTTYGYVDKQKIKDALDYSNLSFAEKMAAEAALLSVKEGWNTMSEIAKSLLSESINLKWGGVVTAISEMSDPDSLYIYLFEELFSYKNGNWVSLYFQVGRPGLVAGAEIFNDFSNIASGILSHAEGNKTYALGAYSHSEGKETTAEGYVSHAEGGLTSALGEYAHTEGYLTEASGARSHAEGANTLASGNIAHAEGSETKATASTAHAEGYDTEASGSSAHAEGSGTNAIGSASHAEGSMTTASDTGAHAEGGATNASAAWTHAEGYGTTASDVSAHAEGQNTTASSIAAHSEGLQTKASAPYSHAEGLLVEASGQASHAEGESTKATANSSHAEGYSTEASGIYTHAEGALTVASGTGAHAEGGSTKATEAWAHAEGYNTTASGNSAHAEGYNTTASGTYSHAGGNSTIASGDNQTVIGKHNTEDKNKAFIIGGGTGFDNLVAGKATKKNIMTVDWDGNANFAGTITTATGTLVTTQDVTDAVWDELGDFDAYLTEDFHITAGQNWDYDIGDYATAEGVDVVASGYASHAEGLETAAEGDMAHAEGGRSQAIGHFSHAEGILTTAVGEAQHVEGRCNIEDTEEKYAHIIGNGTYNEDGEVETASNAHTVDWSGNAWFSGDIKVGGTGYDDENAKTLINTISADDSGGIIVTQEGASVSIGIDSEFITSESEAWHIVDNNGNIIATIDSGGISTTTVAAQNITINGLNIEELIQARIQAYIDQAILGGEW